MAITGIATSDFNGLADLKSRAINDAKGTAPEVAKQFEAIFLQSMLKSMRMGVHFLDESSPFRGRDRETFQEMLDAQYASSIAESKGIGLADILTNPLESTQKTQLSAPSQSFISIPVAQAAAINQIKQSDANPTESVVDDFVKSIWPKAKEAASIIGLDPKLLIAQAALETGWGKFVAKDRDGNSSNNLFNIKKGDNNTYGVIDVKTTEYIADTPIKITDSFRKYPTVEHSFDDYVSLIKGSERYQGALASAGNSDNYVNELYKAGYATDPEYGAKILAIYHGNELTQAVEKYSMSA
ncbi:MAG: flagellar assembly peptidoglycan hydrolase FlgJ [Legionella sp.]|uniref:flagellar assembly peptidoglycan hydrolase FlgJ n=1 Tax=Legionella sp. TaxID=459 RepID=UPI0039E585C9